MADDTDGPDGPVEAVVVDQSTGLATPQELTERQVDDLISTALSLKAKSTQKAYRYAYKGYCEWMSMGPEQAMIELLSLGRGQANLRIMDFMGYMKSQQKSSSTINARLAAIKHYLEVARMAGYIDWRLDVKSVKSSKKKKVSGPTPAQFAIIKQHVDQARSRKELRLKAMVYMLAFMGFRRNEVLSLDIEHLDLDNRKVHALRKGETERKWISVPEQTWSAIMEWLIARGNSEDGGPLFINFDPTAEDPRLGGDSLYRMIRELGKGCGVPNLHPHAFRHFAVTEILEITDGNRHLAQRLSGHKDPRQIDNYDDERNDESLRAAQMIEDRYTLSPVREDPKDDV